MGPGAEGRSAPGSGLGETYRCWRCSSGPGVSTSPPQQQVATGTGWRRCCSRCPLWAQRGQHITLECERPAGHGMRAAAWPAKAHVASGTEAWLLLPRGLYAWEASFPSRGKGSNHTDVTTTAGRTSRRQYGKEPSTVPGWTQSWDKGRPPGRDTGAGRRRRLLLAGDDGKREAGSCPVSS